MSNSSPSADLISVHVGSYDVLIGCQVMEHWPSIVKQKAKAAKYVLISDDHLFALYGPTLLSIFERHDIRLSYYCIPPGEMSKTRETKAHIEDFLFEQGCGRDACLLALGGGVIGDLVGYVASTYMRGIAVVQIPTSLLAMVDSSIGGKTGIDTPQGKNLLGTFHRPSVVLIDIAFLRTLHTRHFSNGMAEVIKAALIYDKHLFEKLETFADNIMALGNPQKKQQETDMNILKDIIVRSVQIKAEVVLQDEREGGMRAILNAGHSIGHAVEAILLPELLHGECVSIGLVEECLLARYYGLLDNAAIRRLENLLKAYALPTKVPTSLKVNDILDKMAVDKKNKGGKKEIVMVTSIGAVKSNPWTTTVPDEHLRLQLSPSVSIHPGSCSGSLSVPGSKSLSNRILLLAALGRGTCVIKGLLHSQDTQVMLDSLQQLGVQFQWQRNADTNEIELVMHGCQGQLKTPQKQLFLNNAGTASRFLTTVVTLLPNGQTILTGNNRMKERPIKDLVDTLRSNGCQIEYLEKQGSLPLSITGNGVGLKGGELQLSANISSQFVSSILLSAPLAASPLVLKLDSSSGKSVVSKPFIDMTVELMKQFGVQVEEKKPFEYHVSQGVWNNPSTFQVEGDASSATYPLALAAVTGGRITVNNVGSHSLQGDAQFCTLLKRMGCQVEQTESTTTVVGPNLAKGEKLTAIEVDMDNMTDTFMTLATVAVFAHGITKITNIANQRVKECDRIAVTVSNLKKIGIHAEEQKDGLTIHGCPDALPSLSARVVINCFDDHRIAMSFSLIASRVSGIIMDEKRCVDKTYPTYWEDLEFKFGLKLIDVQLDESHHDKKTSTDSSCSSSSSISDIDIPKLLKTESLILIGMRGSGKTSLGQYIAHRLNRQFLDLDVVFESVHGNVKQYVTEHGWDLFRAKELEILQKTIQEHPHHAVIACGGGIVETPQAVELLKAQPYVVQVHRHIDDIVAYLNQDQTRPTFDPIAAWERRASLYQVASKYEFRMVPNDHNFSGVRHDFLRFVHTILGHKVAPAPNSFFLSTTCADLHELIEDIPNIIRGIDAIELRVDLLKEHSENFVANQIALVRKFTQLPIIFTVRSLSQGGRFAGDVSTFFSLLKLAVRHGVEYLDVESHWPATETSSFLNSVPKHYPSIIGSHHFPTSNGGSESTIRGTLLRCNLNERADILKLVSYAFSTADATRFIHICQTLLEGSELLNGKPAILLAMGEAGKVSRVLNHCFTPVTSSAFKVSAAPGQMTVPQIWSARSLLGLLPSKRLFLFGSPISASLSPVLHNAAFEWLGLNHQYVYEKLETDSVEIVQQTMAKSDFGGANVTIPLKEKVLPLLNELSTAAREIGAVNTIVVKNNNNNERVFFGDNTDWQGMYSLVHTLLPSMVELHKQKQYHHVAIVIGAGGTSRAALYALKQLGFQGNHLLIHNPRTQSKADALAQEFNCVAITSTEQSHIEAQLKITSGSLIVHVLLSTLPGSAAWTCDESILKKHESFKHAPILFDASYLPRTTAFLAQGTARGLVVLRGIDLLLAQGIRGFKLWMGRLPLPAETHMMHVARHRYEELYGDQEHERKQV